tara:strand:- start:662 stop:1081 length:420 start_codon:yes stop_codon:yes gene_type:complete
MGEGRLYFYLSKDKKSRVARFFPKDWWKGCLYVRATDGFSVDKTVKEMGEHMGLRVLGQINIPSNYRITNATKFYLMDSPEFEDNTLTFSLRWNKMSKQFTCPFELDPAWDEETLGGECFAAIQRFVWQQWPGCELYGG